LAPGDLEPNEMTEEQKNKFLWAEDEFTVEYDEETDG